MVPESSPLMSSSRTCDTFVRECFPWRVLICFSVHSEKADNQEKIKSDFEDCETPGMGIWRH